MDKTVWLKYVILQKLGEKHLFSLFLLYMYLNNIGDWKRKLILCFCSSSPLGKFILRLKVWFPVLYTSTCMCKLHVLIIKKVVKPTKFKTRYNYVHLYTHFIQCMCRCTLELPYMYFVVSVAYILLRIHSIHNYEGSLF